MMPTISDKRVNSSIKVIYPISTTSFTLKFDFKVKKVKNKPPTVTVNLTNRILLQLFCFVKTAFRKVVDKTAYAEYNINVRFTDRRLFFT